MSLVDSDVTLWERITDAAEPFRVQLVDGEIMVNSPATGHQILARRIARHLDEMFGDNGLVLHEMLCNHVRNDQPQRVIPDVVVLPAQLVDVEASELDLATVLLVVEVLSPSTARIDRGAKKAMYADAGIPEYWIADPATGDVTAHMLRADGAWDDGRAVHLS